MGPKKKEKKGKKGKGQKEKPPKTLKSEYVARIAERNAVLAAARKRIQKVEDVYFETDKRYGQTQEDMADIIKYLRHEIEENELEIATFDEKIAAYTKEINQNDKYYQSIFAQMEAEQEEKEKALQYQIQQCTAKLSAFEEVRQQREEFLKKELLLYQKLQETKARHEEEIYEAEKQSIIKQDTIRKEMDFNLVRLAGDFRQARDIAVGETTNKLIRDNIALGNALTCTQEIFEKARDSYCNIYEREKQYRYNVELLNDEHSLVMEKYSKQVNVIETLLKSHEDLHEKILESEGLIKDNRRLQRQIAEKECILKEKDAELIHLSQSQAENRDVFDSVKTVFTAIRKNVVDLEINLFEAAKKVKNAIDIENITTLIDENGDMLVEQDKEEQEENLKEFKYKTRETLIEEIVEKLGKGLKSETEDQLAVLSSEFVLGSGKDSILSSIGPAL